MPPMKIAGLSPAGESLGLGDMLGDQVADETEEMRKKRLAQMQQQQFGGGGGGTPTAGGDGGSLATFSLFGGGAR